MKLTLVRSGLVAALIVSLAGCGNSTVAPSATVTSGNATESNPRAAFSLIVDAGLTPVTVPASGVAGGPIEVNFKVVDSSGNHVPGLTLYNAGGAIADPACSGANVKFSIAQLQADNSWRSLISNKKTVAASVSPSLFVIYGAFDPVQTATIANPSPIDATHPQIVGILNENAAGYYTYRAATDVTDPNAAVASGVPAGTTVLTNGLAVVKDGAIVGGTVVGTVHRAALQLCYVDPVSGATVKVNPYIDFTIGADGKAIPVKDAQGNLTEAKKVVDRASCNACHQNFAMHAGALNEPQVCVM